jgi:hypothetical protein
MALRPKTDAMPTSRTRPRIRLISVERAMTRAERKTPSELAAEEARAAGGVEATGGGEAGVGAEAIVESWSAVGMEAVAEASSAILVGREGDSTG